MLELFFSLSPFGLLLVGGYLFVIGLKERRAPVIKAPQETKMHSFIDESMQLLMLLFAAGTVFWAKQFPPDNGVINAISELSAWAALLSGIILVADDLFIAPRRQLAPAEQARRAPIFIEVLRRLMLLFVVGAIICAIRARSLDFSLWLVIALAATGALWLADIFLLRRQRAALVANNGAAPDIAAAQPASVEYAISFFPVILIVLVIRSFLLEPFRIPSDSMMPTLFDGDFIFVNKYVYGLRLPVVNTKIVDIQSPQRGDVIVFRLPSDPTVNYIKRLVGLPGDRILVRQNQVFINGARLHVVVGGKYTDTHGYFEEQLATEQLGDVKHTIMMTDSYSRDFEGEVPPGHYFFMGDNRNNSQDSRFEQVGFVPEENLVGRAIGIWMNWRTNEKPQWGRIGTKIE
jgi:signal peptidase I